MIVFFLTAFPNHAGDGGRTTRGVVHRYGRPHVKNGQLCDRSGNPIQLRGMSSHDQKRTRPRAAQRFASRGQTAAPEKTSGRGSRTEGFREPPRADGLCCGPAGRRTTGQRRNGIDGPPISMPIQATRTVLSCAGDEALMCLETFWRNRPWHVVFPHSTHGAPSQIEMRPFGVWGLEFGEAPKIDFPGTKTPNARRQFTSSARQTSAAWRIGFASTAHN